MTFERVSRTRVFATTMIALAGGMTGTGIVLAVTHWSEVGAAAFVNVAWFLITAAGILLFVTVAIWQHRRMVAMQRQMDAGDEERHQALRLLGELQHGQAATAAALVSVQQMHAKQLDVLDGAYSALRTGHYKEAVGTGTGPQPLPPSASPHRPNLRTV